MVGRGGGEFVFRCVTGGIYRAGGADAVDFTWDGNDEMDEARGDGWAELQADGSLADQIRFHNGDEPTFTARPWASTAC